MWTQSRAKAGFEDIKILVGRYMYISICNILTAHANSYKIDINNKFMYFSTALINI